MSSLNADFKELIERIRRGREFMHSSFEPIYYLVFRPEQILEVKRETPAWIAKLAIIRHSHLTARTDKEPLPLLEIEVGA